MKIMTLGNGFIAEHLPYEKISDRVQLQWYETKDMLARYRPDVLINGLGRTGRPNVDWCETHKEETVEANTTIPIMLAEICRKLDMHFLHLGSGCVYYGPSPSKGEIASTQDPGWRETDWARPESFYSKTKYATDLVLSQMPHVTILRVRMPVSDKDVPRNLINKLRGYKQVIDIPNSMTLMSDLARCIDWASHKRPGGIFHVTNPQPITAAQIMREYQKYVPEHQFEVIGEHELNAMTVAKRSNCILNTDKLKSAGFKMTDSREALETCMANYVKNMRRTNV